MTTPHNTHPIHLAPLHPSQHSLSTKPSQEDVTALPSRSRARWSVPTWEQVEQVLWASVPIVLHVLGLALLLVAFLTESRPYMQVKQVGGTGLLDYGVLGSCAVPPGSSTERICTPLSLQANFLPSILVVSDAIPGFAPLKLPLGSSQTPAVLLSAIVLLTVSLVIYLPIWILAYFPDAPLPAPLVKFIRFRARLLFVVVGVLSFAAMILTLTIGLGYKLLFFAATMDFNTWITFALFQGLMVNGATQWTAELGDGFDLLWASTTCQALVAIGIKVALHNSQDERVEWPKDSKVQSDWA